MSDTNVNLPFPLKADSCHGMTKRELIAMHLMAALYTHSDSSVDESACVTWSVSGADALLKELDKK